MAPDDDGLLGVNTIANLTRMELNMPTFVKASMISLQYIYILTAKSELLINYCFIWKGTVPFQMRLLVDIFFCLPCQPFPGTYKVGTSAKSVVKSKLLGISCSLSPSIRYNHVLCTNLIFFFSFLCLRSRSIVPETQVGYLLRPRSW